MGLIGTRAFLTCFLVQSEDGMSCERTLVTGGSVCTLCVDKMNGSIIAGVEKVLK